MKHPTNTRIIFADSIDEARRKYRDLKIKSKDPTPVLTCFKVTEIEDFDLSAGFNLVGEISVSPPIMEEIRQDPARAYVLYMMEDTDHEKKITKSN
ncbi:hypothetical protein A6M21_15675 [Desulfotomaculum copahuensis]|uniref:Uncharacterized protein n=1 Tax=Desulfotomaculum copahuensis TaxID=1838280 RepID=A0A1B7LB33_9FIRM|nr:hypothetical protein [Desulfotomaculum copahuensis]OAT79552.1 hypothetical protein A6M21_15675 [Desulfotomaculum copahuensis]